MRLDPDAGYVIHRGGQIERRDQQILDAAASFFACTHDRPSLIANTADDDVVAVVDILAERIELFQQGTPCVRATDR